MVNFADRLAETVLGKGSRVCVGLDPHLGLLPKQLQQCAQRGPEEAARVCRDLCCLVVDATAQVAAAVKPQAAFFEVLGPAGFAVLWEVIGYAKRAGLLVILDAKRSDIGSTAEAYAQAYFHPPTGMAGPDALTVNPYLGSDGVMPFVSAARDSGGGLFVLAKTSNPSSGELQDLRVAEVEGSRRVYEHMGHLIARWGQELIGDCGYSAVGAVVGATYPEQLARLRAELPAVPFLVPGYGAQGAGAQDVKPAFDERGLGAIVNSSRGILFACRQEPYRSRFGDEQFTEAAAAAARDMRDEINGVLGLAGA